MDWGTFSVVFGTMFAAAGTLFAIGVWVGTIQADVTNLKAGFQNLEKRIANIEQKIQNLEKKIEDVGQLVLRAMGIDTPLTDTQSPIALNERGRTLSEAMRADEIVMHYVDEIATKTKGRNAYEIQEECFAFAEKELLPDLKQAHAECYELVADVAFREGVSTKGLMTAVGVLLRDAVLAKHGKTHQEVRATTPAGKDNPS